MDDRPDITEDQLQDAQLGGVPCRAIAWLETTKVEPLPGRRSTGLVDGVRTWRGQAIVEDPAFLQKVQLNAPTPYEGAVIAGDETRQIQGDVYIYHTRRTRPSRKQSDAEAAPQRIYVDFVGAGNL